MTISAEPGHPLFLPEEDDDEPVLVSQIQVTRQENGQQVFAPRVRQASELQSLEQIAGEFGGGTYILIARHEGRITTRRKYVIPGQPKPMFDEAPPPQTHKHVPEAPPSIDPMMAMMGGQNGLMPLIMLMFQQQSQSADRQTQMFMAMMQGTRDSSAEEKAAARAELAASVERERINSERQMAMMREMMQAQRSGGGGSEDFTRGVEFMRTFATQQVAMAQAAAKGEGNDGLSSLLETLGQAFQAAQMVGLFKGAGESGGLPEGVPAAVPEVTP